MIGYTTDDGYWYRGTRTRSGENRSMREMHSDEEAYEGVGCSAKGAGSNADAGADADAKEAAGCRGRL